MKFLNATFSNAFWYVKGKDIQEFHEIHQMTSEMSYSHDSNVICMKEISDNAVMRNITSVNC